MIQITLCGLSHRVTNKDDACEVVARDAIQLLQNEHDINVHYYKWIYIEKLSGCSAILLKKYIEGEVISEFVKIKCIFINKANEVDNLAKTIGFNPIMTTVYRDFAKKARNYSTIIN